MFPKARTFSPGVTIRSIRKHVPHSALLITALIASSVSAQTIKFSPSEPDDGEAYGTVCTLAGVVYLDADNDDCNSGSETAASSLSIFNGADLAIVGSGSSLSVTGGASSTLNGNTSLSGTQAFSGSTTFNSTVSFVGASATFSTPTTFQNPATFNGAADFNGAVTSSGITNTGQFDNIGNINTSSLNTGSIVTFFFNGASLDVSTSLTLGEDATVDMGGNVVGGVAAGVADTDAVNVAQLNAATAGITTDITALETVTATHTAEIAELQTGLETTNENVAANTVAIAYNTANIATNTAAIAENSADIVDLQTGLADTNAALGAVDVRVDALEAVTANLGERLDDLKDRTDAGTATAVALSGGMFLPGNRFNLTGNVGAYRGAIAGAIQFGAMVSARAAVNAGVAKGFNRHGKTAVRTGFSFGW
jgi:hypothetical protein